MIKTKLDLVGLLEQAAGQVFGADERALLEQFLARNTSGQYVEVDLDAVIIEQEVAASEVLAEMTPFEKEALDLANLEGKLCEEIADWMCEAGHTNIVLMQVQAPTAIATMAAEAAASVLMAFERGYRMERAEED